eukprot:4227117-Amphidinium_carterae.1
MRIAGVMLFLAGLSRNCVGGKLALPPHVFSNVFYRVRSKAAPDLLCVQAQSFRTLVQQQGFDCDALQREIVEHSIDAVSHWSVVLGRGGIVDKKWVAVLCLLNAAFTRNEINALRASVVSAGKRLRHFLSSAEDIERRQLHAPVSCLPSERI